VQTNIGAGVIEGFFGRPWEWSARQSGVDFLRDKGFQFFIYAPKADAFLRRRWREPMPEQTMQHLADLSLRCREQGLTFGIGLTPFEIYLNYDAVTSMALRSKIMQLNEIHADLLCILFDDMRGDIAELPDLQSRVIADTCAWSDAERFIVCPTYYSYDSRLAREFGPPPKAYLSELGRSLDSSIDVFWTGEKVISDGYPAQHLAEVAAEIRRKPFIWDNRISNDSRLRTNRLFLDPSAGAWELPAALVAGFAINPMNQPHLSRIALSIYRDLLAAPNRRPSLSEVCRRLAGESCGERLVQDCDMFQNMGLQQIDTDTRDRLIEWYERERTNPYAGEIAAWLRNEYSFDPQCLTS